MKRQLKKIDQFALSRLFKWNYDGIESSSSVIGGFFTIGVFVLIGYGIFRIFQTLVIHTNPFLVYSKLTDQNPIGPLVNPQNFDFAFYLHNPKTIHAFYDETIYTIDAAINIWQRKIDENGTEIIQRKQTKLPLVRCNLLDYHIGKRFHGIPSQESLCINYTNLDEIQIQGVWGQGKLTTISLIFWPCENSTENGNHCKTKEQIKSMIEGSSFTFIYPDIEINSDNFNEPFKYIPKTYNTKISQILVSETFMELKMVSMVTDTGILGSSYNKISRSSCDLVKPGISYSKESREPFVKFIIMMGQNKDQFMRSYTTLLVVLAELIALYKVYRLSVWFFIIPISKFKFNSKLAKECCGIDKNSLETIYPTMSLDKGQRKKKRKGTD